MQLYDHFGVLIYKISLYFGFYLQLNSIIDIILLETYLFCFCRVNNPFIKEGIDPEEIHI